MLPGIDVSSYQAVTPPLAGEAFLIARATYGTSPDSMYAQHTATARSHGIVVGAYHFGRNMDVAQQVTAFLNEAGSPDLFALDLEGDGQNVGMTNAQASAFIAAVQKTGRKCGLYHSTSGYPSLGQDWRWVADYRGAPPPIAWDFWQYQGSPLDRDTFHGDAAALSLLIGDTGGPNVPGGTMKLLATPTGQIGTGIIKAAGVQAFDADGVLIPLRTGQVIPIYGSAKLHTPINPQNAANLDVWLTSFSGTSAYVLKVNVTATLTSPDCTTAVAAATAPLNAKIKSAQEALA